MALKTRAPALARVDAVEVTPFPARCPRSSRLLPAGEGRGDTGYARRRNLPDCAEEVQGAGRRHGYAFTNCTIAGRVSAS